MEMKLRTKIILFIFLNLILSISIYLIPQDLEILKHLCLFKNITGHKCWNCGMTRATIAMFHFDFKIAYELNRNVVLVMPLSVGNYLYAWYKFFIRRETNE